MMRWLLRFCLLAVIVAAGIWAWRVLFPNPAQVIRKRTLELAQAASVAPQEGPLAQVSNASRVASFFTPDIELSVTVPGHSVVQLNGRDDLMAAALRARAMLSGLVIKFPDIVITVAPDKLSATANVTVWGRIPSDKDFIVEELNLRWRKLDGTWLIQHLETVQTLR